jgi:CheY-like chemotaxis protein
MKRRILFVDDEPRVLRGLQRILYRRTDVWDMAFAKSAAEATKLLAREPYDVVVLDINMPGRNGFELLVEIKANPRTRDTEVIVLTGLQDHSLKHEALDLGASDLLSKPVQREELVARVNGALRMKSYQDELRAQNTLLEQRLIQSQKMEVVGMLATGVMHDLNNIFTIILGYSDRVSRHLGNDSPTLEDLKLITSTIDHAQKIAQQILRFAQRAEAPRVMCSLGDVVDDVSGLLKASVPKGVNINVTRARTLPQIQADPTQMYQLLMNLCMNATKAIGERGLLTISLGAQELNEDLLLTPGDIPPGIYAKLEVASTNGEEEQTIEEHIFDPTSAIGESQKETDIGLSVAHWIARDHAGLMTIKSGSGDGKAFSVYLPTAPARQHATTSKSEFVADVR